MVACLQLAIRETTVNIFKQRAHFKEKFQRVLFVLHIAIIVHFSDKLRLDSLEIVTQDVVQDNLMQLADQLKDRMTRIFVDKSSHRRVFQILQLVAQMDRIDHLRVLN